MNIYLVVPGTSTVGVRTLVPRVDIDEHSAVTVQIAGAFAVTSTSVAGESDGLSRKAAGVKRRSPKEFMSGGAGGVCTSFNGNNESGGRDEGGETGKHFERLDLKKGLE